MILFSPPPCDTFMGNESIQKKTHTFTSLHFSLPSWPTRHTQVAQRSLESEPLPQATTPPSQSRPQLIHNTMSAPRDFNRHGSPRSHSQSFSPTLGSIPEVFEYEPRSPPSEAVSPLEAQDIPVYVLPEPATPVRPTLSLRPTKSGIILNPRKATTSRAARVANVLRNVLEADRLRRRRALRIYLKAIVFLKLLLKSHERYGALMATSGLYMQR